MTGKGIRKLRVVSSEQESQNEPEAAVSTATELPELEHLRAENIRLQQEISALGAQLVGFNAMISEMAMECLVGLLIEHGVIDRHEFEVKQAQSVNKKLADALEQVKVDKLAREREEARRLADLEVVQGPGLYVPKGAPRKLHG